MNEICYSAEDAFKKRLSETEDACKNPQERVIYGSAHYAQQIIVHTMQDIKENYARPNCPNKIFTESEPKAGSTGRDGVILYRGYTLDVSKNDILNKLSVATRDELNLFLILANPTILNNDKVQKAFLDRVSIIQKEEKTHPEKQNEENLAYTKFFKNIHGAIYDSSKDAFSLKDIPTNKNYLCNQQIK